MHFGKELVERLLKPGRRYALALIMAEVKGFENIEQCLRAADEIYTSIGKPRLPMHRRVFQRVFNR